MSGIFAQYNLNHSSVSLLESESIKSALNHRAKYGVGSISAGENNSVLLLSCGDKKSRFDYAEYKLSVCIDGYLTNRAELERDLNKSIPEILDAKTDAEIIAITFLRLGVDAISRLSGAYSIIIWDGRDRAMYCVRDVVGIKPLYYSVKEKFVCSSDMAGLFASPENNYSLNHSHLVETIAGYHTSITETAYNNVSRLAPGHYIHLTPDRFEVVQYFEFDLHKRVRYQTDTEYFEHFAEAFEQVVESQLPETGLYGAELSGGIDSTVVAGVLSGIQLKNNGKVDLSVFSQVFPGMECDESEYIEIVSAHLGTRLNKVVPQEQLIFDFNAQMQRHRDLPFAPHYSSSQATHKLASDSGVRTLFAGFGADELFQGSALHWNDAILGLQFRELLTKRVSYGVREDKHLCRKMFSLMVRNFLSGSFRGRILPSRIKSMPRLSYLTKEALHSTGVLDRILKDRTQIEKHQNYAQGAIVDILSEPWFVSNLELMDKISTGCGMDIRYPFLDKNIIQFALALPESMRWRLGERKYILRRAYSKCIPQRVLSRGTKTEFGDLQFKALQKMLNECEDVTSSLSSVGWIDTQAIENDVKIMNTAFRKGDSVYTNYIWKLWCLFSVGIFLNSYG